MTKIIDIDSYDITSIFHQYHYVDTTYNPRADCVVHTDARQSGRCCQSVCQVAAAGLAVTSVI